MNSQSPLPIIIDTDAGTDDIMAISYLLSSPGVQIEAITVVHGVAHVRPGARNIKRLLYVAGKADIPVFDGEERPLKGSRPFPAEWREQADKLPGVDLPQIADPPTFGAVAFLKRRLKDETHPVRILALGPLTHIALVLRDVPEAARTIREMVIMGGAVSVAGNLAPGNPEKAANDVAEWNIYADPDAAHAVFKSGISTLLVPLDATTRVPITGPFLQEFRRSNLTPLGRVVLQVLEGALPYLESNAYFAWDPLAAAAMLDASIVTAKPGTLDVATSGRNIGQTKLVKWNSDSKLRIAVDADGVRFHSAFERAFVK